MAINLEKVARVKAMMDSLGDGPGRCGCEFIEREDDGSDGWHYARVCTNCGAEVLSLHCAHDGFQNACPVCHARL